MAINTLDAVNTLVSNQFDFLKRLTELNIKTAKSLQQKNTNILQFYLDSSAQYTDKLFKSQAQNQQSIPVIDLLNEWNTKWLAHWQESATVLKDFNQELKSVTEASLQTFQTGTAQLVEASRQAATDATEKTKTLVDNTSAEVIDLSKNITDKSSEILRKTAH